MRRLAIANICFTTLLSLKNTPLALLTGWTYERLNVFHRVVGYVALAMVAVHGATYTAHFMHEGNATRLRVVSEIYGMVAGGSMLVLVSAGVVLRRLRYEAFYILHVSFFIAAMVFTGLHQPDVTKSIVFATVGGAGIWIIDRMIRGARVLFYSLDNSATAYPLPGGGTRIVVRRTPSIAKPGEHCFVWIPKIRLAEMHPFTIVSVEPLEFVVSSRGGFTRDLYEYAANNPGARLRASVDGPYGKRVDATAYDTVVMIAGGSGASYPVGLALEMQRRATLGAHQRVVLVWAVRDYSKDMSSLLIPVLLAHFHRSSSVVLGPTGNNPQHPGPLGFSLHNRSLTTKRRVRRRGSICLRLRAQSLGFWAAFTCDGKNGH